MNTVERPQIKYCCDCGRQVLRSVNMAGDKYVAPSVGIQIRGGLELQLPKHIDGLLDYAPHFV